MYTAGYTYLQENLHCTTVTKLLQTSWKIPNRKWYYKYNAWHSVYEAITLFLKYVKSEENVCDYSSRYPYKDLPKVKKLIHYMLILLLMPHQMHWP